eukprot:TRINITY_DN904_c0_g2_i1.p1 TRINITY_DN904_c0_g2~~TRINITY_DN904_c0_g2_i1.p1  ORF type:complete len:102 (-),score=18.84 TRINITY_DN904_c0_g2_i1:567-872(-)
MLLLEADITERREEDEGAGAYFYDFLTTQSTRKVIDSKFFSNTLKHTNSSNREAQRREKVLLRKRLQEERKVTGIHVIRQVQGPGQVLPLVPVRELDPENM